MSPAAILDIVLIAVLAISLILGLARGLVQTLLSVVIFVVALLGSAWVADAAAAPVTDYLMPYIEQVVTVEITESIIAPQTASLSDDTLFQSFGEGFGQLVRDMVDSAVASGMEALSGALEGIVHTAVYVVLFLLSLLLIQWALRLITTPLRLVEKLPVLGLLNRLGGAALGLVMGVLLCFLITAVVKLTGFIDPAETTLYAFFAANTPAGLLAALR